jgi:hypothetical protein
MALAVSVFRWKGQKMRRKPFLGLQDIVLLFAFVALLCLNYRVTPPTFIEIFFHGHTEDVAIVAYLQIITILFYETLMFFFCFFKA